MKSKTTKRLPPEPVEWDLSQPFGVLPQDLPLTHNMGCVRTATAKKEPNRRDSDAPNSKK